MKTIYILLSTLMALLTFSIASAGPYPGQVGTCTYDATSSVVTAINLPTVLPHAVYGSDTAVINFIRENSTGNVLDAFVLGHTDTGTMTVAVPAPIGTEVYEFVSQTWGNASNLQYSIYAECNS